MGRKSETFRKSALESSGDKAAGRSRWPLPLIG